MSPLSPPTPPRSPDAELGFASILHNNGPTELSLIPVPLKKMLGRRVFSLAQPLATESEENTAAALWFDDGPDDTLTVIKTRTFVEGALFSARNNGTDAALPSGLAALLGEARKFPDIAQSSLDFLPPWALSPLRKTSKDALDSRYIFAPNCRHLASQGLYHVDILHGGATLLVCRTSRFQSRVIHDPISVEPEEYDAATLSFLKTFAFLRDPIAHADISQSLDSPLLRSTLGAIFTTATGQHPFHTDFLTKTTEVSDALAQRPQEALQVSSKKRKLSL